VVSKHGSVYVARLAIEDSRFTISFVSFVYPFPYED